MPTATKPARPTSYEAKFNLARRADLDAKIAKEAARFYALSALASLQTRSMVEREAARYKAFERKYGPPPTPRATLHRMADASGRVWQHRDFSVLKSWMVDRNKLLLAQAAAQKTGRGYGQVENKAVYPNH